MVSALQGFCNNHKMRNAPYVFFPRDIPSIYYNHSIQMGKAPSAICIVFLQPPCCILSLASAGQLCESSPVFTSGIAKGWGMFQSELFQVLFQHKNFLGKRAIYQRVIFQPVWNICILRRQHFQLLRNFPKSAYQHLLRLFCCSRTGSKWILLVLSIATEQLPCSPHVCCLLLLHSCPR